MAKLQQVCIENFCSDVDSYTAGANIQIAQDGTISATDTTYTAGDNVEISDDVISAEEQEWTKDYPSLGEPRQSVVQNDIENNDASGNFASASGTYTTASGEASHAEGFGDSAKQVEASGKGAHAEGIKTLASGNWGSHAEGNETIASGLNSHAEGSQTTASKNQAHAEGYATTASGQGAHAEGRNTLASGDYSHAEGESTTASGTRGHAEGSQTTASANNTHAEGFECYAAGNQSHAGGYYSNANGVHSFVHGANSLARRQGSVAIGQAVEAAASQQFVCGGANVVDDSGADQTRGTYMLIVGNGSITWGSDAKAYVNSRSNAMTVGANGDVTATNFIQGSDERLKENFEDLDIADAFMELEPVGYSWKEEKPDGDQNMNNDGKRHFGMKAQDVEAILEKYELTDYGMVKEMADGYKTLNYIEFIPWLIKMVQDQQTVIAELKERIEG